HPPPLKLVGEGRGRARAYLFGAGVVLRDFLDSDFCFAVARSPIWRHGRCSAARVGGGVWFERAATPDSTGVGDPRRLALHIHLQLAHLFPYLLKRRLR